ncbi:MAG: hypothetical protein IT279_12735 [Ignavibacteriaceae bacterium]|nr:hypothetical protein [Ignavibacteriaceae bacterium]
MRIVSGEGNWHYTLSAGANTPANQYDDTLDMLAPGYNTGFNELEFITLTVGSYTYTNYCRLDQWNSGP